MAIAWSALLGGAVIIGSSTKPNICSVANHSTDVRILGGRCDSSRVASVERGLDLSAMTGIDVPPRLRALTRALAAPPARLARRARVAGGAADRRDAAGGAVRPADLRELGDRPARGGDRGRDRRRSRPRTRCSSRSSTTCAATPSSAPRPGGSRTWAAPGEQLLIIPPGAEAPLPEELAALQRAEAAPGAVGRRSSSAPGSSPAVAPGAAPRRVRIGHSPSQVSPDGCLSESDRQCCCAMVRGKSPRSRYAPSRPRDSSARAATRRAGRRRPLFER